MTRVANHQHPAAGSFTTGKIVFPEPRDPVSPLFKQELFKQEPLGRSKA
ncbi:MAG TPA: hypothetical protein VJ418_21255 [Streptosporangiaceae bacterium]|nr:hypothetical protein [Streptosporangiaceae bacterium]